MLLAPRSPLSIVRNLAVVSACVLALGATIGFVHAAEAPSGVTEEPHPEINTPPLGASVTPPTASTEQRKVVTTKPAPKRPVLNQRPLWVELTPAQQEALEPLSSRWNSMSEAHKRKWIALSHNFKSLSTEEQEKLHSRMAEWVGLTVQERVQARLNFAQTKKLAPEEKRAQWEAYQALTEEERKELATQALVHPMGAATPAKPVPARKLAMVPVSKSTVRSTGKIETGPHHVDMHTLLPTTSGTPAASSVAH
ncbi:DUF3106 domain-containing protein [Curvibacter gracilis]|uniref:DUF3106 domain-containing protein n=1 Tax=Curvibacter gracilis TaxID=230310 RepID=UPI000A060603|nr:DUF3106 domain-containing protein [Curvibacter gracilis]